MYKKKLKNLIMLENSQKHPLDLNASHEKHI
jgi:hypothetical protein